MRQLGMTGVYFLVENDQVVYVGQSTNVFRRITEHTDKKFDEWFWIEVDKEDLDRVESIFIKQLTPKHNKSNTVTYTKPPAEKKFVSLRECNKITGLSLCYLRRGIENKTIPHIKSGKKFLINLPLLMEILNNNSEGFDENHD